jgi:hypothetical protein
VASALNGVKKGSLALGRKEKETECEPFEGLQLYCIGKIASSRESNPSKQKGAFLDLNRGVSLFFWRREMGRRQMEMNPLKLWFLDQYGTLWNASQKITIDKSAFSLIYNYHRGPTAAEREKLRAAMGPYYYRKFFAKAKAAKLEGKNVVNE